MTGGDSTKATRIALIMKQLTALPTLSAIAVRLLDVTVCDESSARDVIELIESDPALSTNVLRMCRCHPRGRDLDVTTIDRAVVLLGFDAVRTAVLSVQILELLNGHSGTGGEKRQEHCAFDCELFWLHSIAVAIAAEAIVDKAKLTKLNPNEAFLAGLLHDLGMLALHVILPQSFDSVSELAESHGVSLSQACKKVIGIDIHTAGKRLAEHWRLPPTISDVLWLSGQPISALPDIPHRQLVAVVTIADALARHQHIGPAGHGPRGEDLTAMASDAGIPHVVIDDIMSVLHESVAQRASALGLGEQHGSDMLLRAIARANELLGRRVTTLQTKANASEQLSRSLGAVTQFLARAAPGESVVSVLESIAQSVSHVCQTRIIAGIFQASPGSQWSLVRFSDDGSVADVEIRQPPRAVTELSKLPDDPVLTSRLLDGLALSSHTGQAAHNMLRLMPIPSGFGVSALMVCAGAIQEEHLDALMQAWGAALAAAAQHEGVQRLSEQLAESNRAMTEMQATLADARAKASVAEITAGAAHEMNNPLTVISGRSQILVNRLRDPEMKEMAEQISEQSHRLSDMITALQTLSHPSPPKLVPSSIQRIVKNAVEQCQKDGRYNAVIETQLDEAIADVMVDADQISEALREVLRNALEAEGAMHIRLRVQTDRFNDRLRLQVMDDGKGLSKHALIHAFDPFFSEKPAGRQPGLGLAHARRIVEAHGGTITLENDPAGGAVVTMQIDAPPAEAMEQRGAA